MALRKKQRRGIEVAGGGHSATADNVVDNQPDATKTATVAFRDATFSKTTRDRLAELSGWLKAHRLRDEHDADGAFAIDDVVARWDANDATEFDGPDEPFTAEGDEA